MAKARKKSAKSRVERDAFGPLEIPADRLWGAQTQRSIHNFRIGTERMPIEIMHARTSPTGDWTSIFHCWSGRLVPERRAI